MDTRPSAPASPTATATTDTFVGGALVGLLPLGLLAGLVALTLLLTTITRLIVTSQGFFVEQEVDLIVLATGLTVAGIVYVVATVRALRRLANWQRDGAGARSRGTLVALTVTALVVVAPVVVALLLPQHPAP